MDEDISAEVLKVAKAKWPDARIIDLFYHWMESTGGRWRLSVWKKNGRKPTANFVANQLSDLLKKIES